MVDSKNNSTQCSSDERCDSYGHGPKMKAMKIPSMTNEDDLPLVTVIHVESPSLFFVYFNIKNYNLDKELNIFMPQYKSMFEFGDEPPALMTRCVCSYSSDGNWYRAVVVSTSVSEEHSLLIKVYFCDYGNTEDIPWEERRIYRMPNYFATKAPMQAIPCALYGIQPAEPSGWSPEEIDNFFTKLSDFTDGFQAAVKCRFYLTPRIEGAVAFVNLLLPDSDGSFREQMTDIGRRWSISSNYFDLQSICSSIPDFLFSLLPVQLPEDKTVFVKPSEVVRLKSQVSRIDKNAAKQFIHRHLGISANDGAPRERGRSSSRSSHLNKDAARKLITRHLGIDDGSRRSSSRSSGLPRVRGRVNSRRSMDSKRATDEGEDDNEEEEGAEVERSGTCSPITTVACRPPKPCTDFPYGSVRIRSPRANIPDLKLRCTNDRVFHVIVSCVESPDRFFVNICSAETSELMSWLEEAMHHHYCDYYQGMMKQFLDENWSPAEGDVVCAETSDNFFGRAIVEQVTRKKKTGTTARLYFIDYGFTETDVPLAKIHVLSPEYFYRVPAQAVLCSLADVSGSWGPEDRERVIQACGEPDRQGAISGLAMFIPRAQDHWDAELTEPVPVLLSRIDDDFLINSVFSDKCEIESNLGADVGSSLGKQSGGAMSESSGIDADWNVTDAIFQQSLNKQADLKRSGTSVAVCQFFKVRGKCMWGDKCRMYHTREDYEDDRINLEFERNVDKMEEVSYLDTGKLMNYPRKGAWVGIVVTVLFQPNRFYGQLLHGTGDYRFPVGEDGDIPDKTLAQLRNSMNLFYNDELPADMSNKIYAPTELVAVRCLDNNWYRAAVLDHDSDRDDVVVKLLDTGDVQCIRQSWVQPLNSHFLTELPVQAFECFLTGVKRPLSGWSKQAWRTVVGNVEGRPLHARVDDVSPTGILTVTLWNTHNRSTKDYVCVNNYLKENGLAVSDEVASAGPWACADDPKFVLYPG